MRGSGKWRVRTAIGAAPDRLVRQLLTESVVLALAGPRRDSPSRGRAFAFSWPSIRPAFHRWRRSGWISSSSMFTLVLGVGTTILFGLVPALRTLRVDLVESLREGGQQATLAARVNGFVDCSLWLKSPSPSSW